MIVGDRDVTWSDGDGWQPSEWEVGAEIVPLPSEGGSISMLCILNSLVRMLSFIS